MQHRAARHEAFRYVGTPDDLQVSEEPPEMLWLRMPWMRREDRLLVGLQDGEPGREILRVIRSPRVSDAEIGAEEGGSEFRDLS
jgi:hypothetical protein